MKPTTITTALFTIALPLAAVACGGSTATTTVEPATTNTTTAVVERPSDIVDELVAIDGGRLHLRCSGSGDVTVLLVAGWDAGSDRWSAVEPSVGERSRVCSYDRFGTGTSDPPPVTQTFESQSADLHALLDEAGEPGPYVVAGHSFGGAEAVTFASRYPDEVAGLVLVDASPTTWPATVCSVPAYAAGCAVMHDPALDAERLDVFPAFEAVAAIGSLGDLPMTVVTAAHRTDPTLEPAELARLDSVWDEGVDHWAALSTSSRVVTVEDTGHDIHVEHPQVVIEELERLLP
jgi:pimeloyl-ACP methyl ester carboxylesterase